MMQARGWREPWLSIWAIVAAFGTYFCMYAFRKPFEVGGYTGELWPGVELFTLLVSAQTVGYTLSKFLGIKFISEMRPGSRLVWLLGLITFAELALVGFALAPPPWGLLFLFLNGLPLGMVFGLVMGFLEGRQTTEALLAGLCASFIVSSGAVKSVGKTLLIAGVSAYWMPALTGLLFVPPLLLCVWMLAHIPPPDGADVAQRTARVPMSRADRWAFFHKYALGVTLLLGYFVLLTILRSVRDVYADDIWKGLGYGKAPGVFAQSETLVMLGVVVINGLAMLFRNNRVALFAALATGAGGLVLALGSQLAFDRGSLDGFAFMVLLGLGGYLAYVSFHTTLLDRLIALLRDRGNIGFLMYLADSFGYLGFVVVINTATWVGWLDRSRFLEFFHHANHVMIALSLLVVFLLGWYFAVKKTPPSETLP
jgi:hypothetical protein